MAYPDQFALVACWTSAAEAAEAQAGTTPSAQATVAADMGMSLLGFIPTTEGPAGKKSPALSEETVTNSRRDRSVRGGAPPPSGDRGRRPRGGGAGFAQAAIAARARASRTAFDSVSMS